MVTNYKEECYRKVKGDFEMELSKYIEHTNLDGNSKTDDIQKICEEAMQYHFEMVCVSPFYVPLVKEMLEKSNVGIKTIIGYPYGMNTLEAKEYEAIDVINKGAEEIALVLNVGCIKDQVFDYSKKEIETIRDAIGGRTLSVVVPSSLEEEQLEKIVEICNETFIHTITLCGNINPTLIDCIKNKKGELLEIGIVKENLMEEEAIVLLEASVTHFATNTGLGVLKKEKKEGCQGRCSSPCTCHHEENFYE